MALAKDVGQRARKDDAILERIANARRRARSIGEHDDASARCPADVRGIEREIATAWRNDADARPEEGGMGEGDLGGEVTVREQPSRSVQIGQDGA
jgi:hypothetical protein